jgi:uncharacterized protein YkwD
MRQAYPKTVLAGLFFLSCAAKPYIPDIYSVQPGVPEIADTLSQDVVFETVDLLILEWAIFLETNNQRERLGMRPFRFQPLLRLAACQHSEEMVALDYFEHTSPVAEYETLSKRLNKVGLRRTFAGENIAIYPGYRKQDIVFWAEDISSLESRRSWRNYGRNYTYEEFAEELVMRWMQSPPHRRNIMNHYFRYLGVGIAKGVYKGSNVFYVTQNFSSPNY